MATPNGEAETKGEKISRLLKLAEKEFGTLSEAEKKFFLAAASGEIADYRAEKEEDNDPTKAKDWGPERVLNADRIAWLCTDSLASSLVTHKGVWVNGAGIEGHLDLKFAQISFPLFFRGSAFPYGINFQHAELRGLHLPGTHTGPILAEGINVKGDILLWDGFLVNGGMRLTGATINRNLECGGGRFINKEGEAFNAEGINVKGSVFLDEFFIAEGEVCLSGAVIGGNLVCGNGKFFNQKGKAFLAKGLNVNGSVFFNNIFQSIGEVNLLEATINGSLNCDGGIFLNGKGHAIFADGLKVNGSVFLRNYFNATGEVRLRKVTINGDFNCIKGKFSNKNKEKKDVYALSADGLNIKGTVFMRDGFQAEGEVRLPDAKIGGGFDCTKGTFLNEGGRALSADRVNVKSGVFCSELQAKGEVRLPGAIIDGNLECGNGTFLNKEGRAVFADGIEVKGNVFFNGGFRAKGEVRLPGATINGSLDCIKGTFTKKRNGEREAYALNADGANIKGSVFLREGFQAEGEVRLPNAEIGGYLDCENGKFKNEGAYALSLDGLKVKGSVHLRDEFQAEGQVCLVGVTIEGLFSWTKVDSPEKTILNLRYAKIGTLDDPDSWPQGGNLLLDGLVYNNIADLAPKDAQKRIGWLHRQPFESFRPQPHEQSAPVLLKNFWPQPYEQLASVLRKSGHEEDAKQILIQKNEDRARLQMPFIKRWLYRILFGWTVGYGYRPVRTLGWIAGFIALGCFVFWIGFQADVITPTKKEAYIFEQSGKSSEVSQRYPGFSALAFSVDTFVPLINLHQADYWLPNTKRWLYWYMCFHIVMGWIFTTLFIMGLTGLIRS